MKWFPRVRSFFSLHKNVLFALKEIDSLYKELAEAYQEMSRMSKLLLKAQERGILTTKKLVDLDKRLTDIASIGVDVHFKSPHEIWIFSSLGGGRVRHISIELESYNDLQRLVDELKRKYGVRNRVFYDIPPGMAPSQRPPGLNPGEK